MTPIFIAPPELPPPPSVASAIVLAGATPAASTSTLSGNFFVPFVSEFVPVQKPDFPLGIDYEAWAPIVQPSPREAFVDRLDILDELPDDY